MSRNGSAPSLFRPAVLMACVFVAAKAILLGKPEDVAWFGQLVALTWQDVLCAAAYGLVGALALRLTRRHPAAQRFVWGALILAGALSIAYAVVHVGFYEAFRRAITAQMLGFAGSVKNLSSSVTARLTWPYVVALALLPLLFVAAFRRMQPGASRAARIAASLLVPVWGLVGHQMLRRSGQEWMERMGANPHFVLLSSLVQELRGSGGVTLPRQFSPEDLEEFRTIAERSHAGAAGTTSAPAARIRNVILIVLESTGTRYLSLYGSRYDTTPNLVAEAKNSLVVDHFYANVGHTVCSFMVLNFSLYPGLPWCYVPCGERPLPQTLPELLRGRGYRTALLSSADMNYEGMAWAAEHHGYEAVRHYWDLGCPALSSWGAADRCVVDGVLRFIDEKPGAPFYVMAWTSQAHDPYVLSPDEKVVDFAGAEHGRADLGRYLNILRTTDAQIARLLAGLRSRGLDEDTLVVITGDHGEAFGEPHDYVGHGGVLYDESVRVPLVLWNPKVFGGAGRSSRVAAHVDLNPTLAELLGVPPPAGWQGASLLDPGRPDRAFFFTGIGEYQFGVREGRYKYVHSATFAQGRLYDLDTDPDELVDRSAEHPELCLRLRRRLAAWIAYEEQLLMGTRASASGPARQGLQRLPALLPLEHPRPVPQLGVGHLVGTRAGSSLAACAARLHGCSMRLPRSRDGA